NANMFRFEDKQGSEQVKLHAERNYDTSVEANTTHTTAGSHTIEVGLPLASGDSSTSPPPSGAQRLLQQQAGTRSAGQQLQQAMAARRGKRGRKAYAHREMQQSTTPAAPAIQPAHHGLDGTDNFFAPKVDAHAFSLTVNGNENKLIAGESTSLVLGIVNDFVGGDENRLNVGNKLDVIGGLSEELHTIDVAATGAEVKNTGSVVENKGSEITSTGSSISSVGSEVSNTGSSVQTVGYEVKF
ncbi:bacteriophage T4 gp5 trimerisation domain-containing protein, partial [Caballeronia sp. LZ035]|uniref:bacteriophage T4 gp5 trimerisation domain-containing protein n=1 Tax=Caballeronia sp. LZ035 TaxID=3038568 RepID=UPI002862558E|nr:hypothetical protein [Caballeronia sp. LZ035]